LAGRECFDICGLRKSLGYQSWQSQETMAEGPWGGTSFLSYWRWIPRSFY